MINRPEYLKKLLAFKDQQLIKIVTGIRRCGKSTLFKLYQAELIKQGVAAEQIQSINLEDVDNEHLLDYKVLHEHIKTHLASDKQNYIFLDEIQNVKDFEKAVRSLFDKGNVDLYLTGSNSKLQSGEWATSLAGRYVEIHMFPLSFKEYVSAFPYTTTKDLLYSHYIEYSSFPQVINMIDSNTKFIRNKDSYTENKRLNAINEIKSQVFDYLSGIYSTIVLKDVVENKKIREVGRLERVVKFMADNIGSITSIKRISDMLTSDGVKIMPLTIESYLDAFCNSYILYKADRYDVKGRNLLKTLNKYYLVDLGLRRFLLGDKAGDSGHVLENVVYLELLRREYKVYIGKVGEKEVDFVVEGPSGTEYYQVSETVRDKNTLARELAPLESIRDHNPKFLLTRDDDPQVSYNGIKQINVLDWLLKE